MNDATSDIIKLTFSMADRCRLLQLLNMNAVALINPGGSFFLAMTPGYMQCKMRNLIRNCKPNYIYGKISELRN